MKVPFVCNKCEKEYFDELYPIEKPCKCGGIFHIEYRDNYEQDHEVTRCNTCVHYRVGNGEKCNYCSNI